MAAQRKRKHAAVEEEPTAGRPNVSAKLQKRIKSFGHVSKPHEAGITLEMRKMRRLDGEKPQAALAVQAVSQTQRKRKHSIEAVVEIDHNETSVPAQRLPTPSTPRSKRSRNAIPPSPARSAAALFDRLSINKHSSFTDPSPGQNFYDTPPATPDADEASALQQLQGLYSSFLSALSLHYSHNGTSSPVSVQVLLPMVTKHWQKRTVSLDDLRMLFAIDQNARDAFSLQDYGRTGICLTCNQPRASSSVLGAGHINKDTLNAHFDDSLQRVWRDWKARTPRSNRSAEAFLDQIPLLEIPKNESVDKAAPLFARGQQRLADIKSSSAAAQLSGNARIVAGQAAAPRSAGATTTRGSALLDRVIAKQNLASTLSSGPTKAQLERRAALDRVEDIARVLCLLAGAKERASFSMAIAAQHLQQSLRNPISNAEAQRCLALMATEIMPEFVKIVMSEGVHGVVVTRSGNVGLSEMRARLEKARS